MMDSRDAPIQQRDYQQYENQELCPLCVLSAPCSLRLTTSFVRLQEGRCASSQRMAWQQFSTWKENGATYGSLIMRCDKLYLTIIDF